MRSNDPNIKISSLFGLVLSGGKSSRMGIDKGLLKYHDVEQRLHVCQLLSRLCTKTFVSQNPDQVSFDSEVFDSITDDPEYAGHGPISGLLTAFKREPGASILVVGCDYPFLGVEELERFLSSIPSGSIAAAFFNEASNCYEPVLAWYSPGAGVLLADHFANGSYSLQRFLQVVEAYRYLPKDIQSIRSVDTLKEYREIMESSRFTK